MKPHKKILLLILSYNLLFLLFCFGARLLSDENGFKVHKVFSSFSWETVITGVLGREVLFFIGAQLLLHLLFSAGIFLAAAGVGKALKLQGKNLVTSGHCLTVLAFLLLLFKNAEWYPYSFYAGFFEDFIQSFFGSALILFLQVVFAGGIACALLVWLRKVCRRGGRSLTMVFCATILTAGIFLLARQAGRSDSDLPPHFDLPNIFIIGIDSLRPDHVGSLGYPRNTTPHIDTFLQKALILPEAMTPLGRTFPSWTSILTGQYPRTSGARFNLIGKSPLRFQKTLADILREKGYTTVYACDEKRFANFDASYGFDFVLGPGMGAADFLLGSLGDLPLSNMIINTWVGKVLFPFSHGNRAADVTYRPAVFSRELSKFFDQPLKKPLFFAVHFCLPHFPYRWNGDQNEVVEGPKAAGIMRSFIEDYDRSLHAADRQAGELLALLERKKLLENALVLLISDHGESFFDQAGDFLFEAGKGTLALGQSETLALKKKWGHGSSLLGYSQNRCLLAFRDFRRDHRNGEVHSERVSLVDIAPTLMNYLGLENGLPFDGLSLAPLLNGAEQPELSERIIYLETGFNPTDGEVDVPEMIKKGLHFYRIDSQDGFLSLKPEYLTELIQRKERAAIQGDHYLVLGEFFGRKWILALDMKTGEWTSNLAHIQKSSPYGEMLSQMVSFYGDELVWLKISSNKLKENADPVSGTPPVLVEANPKGITPEGHPSARVQ